MPILLRKGGNWLAAINMDMEHNNILSLLHHTVEFESGYNLEDFLLFVRTFPLLQNIVLPFIELLEMYKNQHINGYITNPKIECTELLFDRYKHVGWDDKIDIRHHLRFITNKTLDIFSVTNDDRLNAVRDSQGYLLHLGNIIHIPFGFYKRHDHRGQEYSDLCISSTTLINMVRCVGRDLYQHLVLKDMDWLAYRGC